VKKILIIDNTFDPPHGCPEIQELVRKAAKGLGPVEVSFARAPDELIPTSLTDFNGVILSGSKTRIDENAPWIEKEIAAIRRLHSFKIPTFGICYGEQLIARAFGGDAGTAKRYEFGWVEIEATQSPLFEGLPSKFHSFEYHNDEVRTLPANFSLTASSKDCPIQAFDVTDAPMWGVQFHPERGIKQGEKSVEKFSDGSRTVTNGDRGEELFDARVGETIFRNFLKQVWGR
jgi:GMP synthase (glutamine-hydrolysing)